MKQCRLLKRQCEHKSIMASNKPYLVRAIFDWCIDSDLTPYLIAKLLPGTRVPKSQSKSEEIILNISPAASTKLIIDNNFVSFFARFNGINEEIYIPMSPVAGIYSHENGEGLFFEINTKNLVEANKQGSAAKPNKKNKPSHLTLVK